MDGRSVTLLAVSLAFVTSAALGMFGHSLTVTMLRRRQIAVRRALGATRLEVARWLMVESALVVAVGLVTGAAAAVAVSWLLKAVAPAPPLRWPLVLAAALLVGAICVAASAVAARRASQVTPTVASRGDG